MPPATSIAMLGERRKYDVEDGAYGDGGGYGDHEGVGGYDDRADQARGRPVAVLEHLGDGVDAETREPVDMRMPRAMTPMPIQKTSHMPEMPFS